jgi:hypothetical protein
MLLRLRSPIGSSITLRVLAVGLGAGLAAQACADGAPSGSSAMGIGGGTGGAACAIGTLAQANIGAGACSKNSLGGSDFETSCTGNGGSPEYWCADFARWVWSSSGADVGGLTAAAASFYTYGKTHGTLTSTPQIGDAVVYAASLSSTPHHVAIVTQVNTDGTIETVSGDWNGMSGSEAHFASTSHVVLNSPAYPGTVGTAPGVMGMTIVSFVTPSGITACSGDSDGGSGSEAGGGGGASGSSGGGGPEGGGSSGEAGGGGSGGSAGGGAGGGGGSGGGGGGGGGSGGSGGGSKGGGGGGAGKDAGSGYAFFETRQPDHHHTFGLAPGASETISFAWHVAAGLAPTADLWVEVAGRPALQVSAVDDSPFVRAGLEVVRLVPDASYRLELSRKEGSIETTVRDATDEIVLHAAILGDSSADVVLPSEFWRASVTTDLH